MINLKNIIKMYADTLYEVSKEESVNDVFLYEFSVIEKVLKCNLNIIKILHLPTIDKFQKKQIVDIIFKDKINIFIINFFKVLIDNNRFILIFEIIDEYCDIYYNDNDIQRVEITSAVYLDDDNKQDVISKCELLLNKKVVATYVIDKQIIGGLIIKANNMLYDMSIKNKIENIRKSISEIIIS